MNPKGLIITTTQPVLEDESTFSSHAGKKSIYLFLFCKRQRTIQGAQIRSDFTLSNLASYGESAEAFHSVVISSTRYHF